MSGDQPGNAATLEIRKYSNRRYYDTSRSKHVTIEEIHALICEGREIRVTDAKTGADITAKVLAQIILERDPPKLDVFPVPLLHRLIRANEQLVRDFVEKYFNQALSSFLQSQQHFEGYMRRMMGLGSEASVPGMLDWTRSMFGPFAAPFWRADDRPRPEAGMQDTSGSKEAGIRQQVDDLKQQVARLEGRLAARRKKRRRASR